VSDNGQHLAGLLDRLTAAWPGQLEEILLIGHSMGGLVIRSACHYGRQPSMAWARQVRHVSALNPGHRADEGYAVDEYLVNDGFVGCREAREILGGEDEGIAVIAKPSPDGVFQVDATVPSCTHAFSASWTDQRLCRSLTSA
jgi:pimeloyl-ACP methyl ester carboxylesterase